VPSTKAVFHTLASGLRTIREVFRVFD